MYIYTIREIPVTQRMIRHRPGHGKQVSCESLVVKVLVSCGDPCGITLTCGKHFALHLAGWRGSRNKKGVQRPCSGICLTSHMAMPACLRVCMSPGRHGMIRASSHGALYTRARSAGQFARLQGRTRFARPFCFGSLIAPRAASHGCLFIVLACLGNCC